MVAALFFRVESTGIPKRTAQPGQEPPRIVRLSAKLIDASRREMASMDALFRQDGYSISGGAARAKHGLGDRDLVSYGVRPIAALALFMDMSRAASELVAFNLDFASVMIEIEMERLKSSQDDWRRSGLKRRCLMVQASQQLRAGKPISMDGVLEDLEWPVVRKIGLDAIDQIADMHWELEFRRRVL